MSNGLPPLGLENGGEKVRLSSCSTPMDADTGGAKGVTFVEAFLTGQEEREKKRKEQLKVPSTEPVTMTMKKVVEDHHDDCGKGPQRISMIVR